jgi:hypothetical protein
VSSPKFAFFPSPESFSLPVEVTRAPETPHEAGMNRRMNSAGFSREAEP